MLYKRQDDGNKLEESYAEAVTPSVKPEPHHLVDGVAHDRILPVEVGLSWDV